MVELRQNTINAFDLEKFLKDTRQDIHSQVDFAVYACKICAFAKLQELWVDNELAGISACYMNDVTRKVAYLTQLIIKPDYRGRGYGKFLLQETEHLAQELGMSSMELEVFCVNECGRRFYNKMGYCIKEPRNNKFLLVKKICGVTKA